MSNSKNDSEKVWNLEHYNWTSVKTVKRLLLANYTRVIYNATSFSDFLLLVVETLHYNSGMRELVIIQWNPKVKTTLDGL